jgi:hypothetical protein
MGCPGILDDVMMRRCGNGYAIDPLEVMALLLRSVLHVFSLTLDILTDMHTDISSRMRVRLQYLKDAGERIGCDECLARFIGLCGGVCERRKR